MLLRAGIVVDHDGTREADVRVGADGRVAEVGPGLEARDGERVVDCAGQLVVPGGVDVHTHFHLPVGQVRVSDDFETGTRAAANARAPPATRATRAARAADSSVPKRG